MKRRSWFAICLLPPLAACWIDSMARESRPLIPDRPPTVQSWHDESTDDRTAGSGVTTPEVTVEQIPLPALDDLPKISAAEPRPRETKTALLSGGLRIAAGTGGDQLAWFRLTIPNRRLAASQIALASLTARLVVDSPRTDAGKPSLRQEIETQGGWLDVSTSFRSTRFTIAVPKLNWQRQLERLIEAIRTTPNSRARMATTQRELVRDFTQRLASDPMYAAIERVVAFEPAGPIEWIKTAQDTTAAKVALFHRDSYSANGSVISAIVPGNKPYVTLLELQRISAPWCQSESNDTPDDVPSLPNASGVFWADSPGDSRVALVYELPSTAAADAAAWLTAIECLSASGIGGRIDAELRAIAAPSVPFRAELVSNGAQRRLHLLAEIPADRVPTLYEAVRGAARSCTKRPPELEEIKVAAARARLRLMNDLREPEDWLDEISRALMTGERPDYRVVGDEVRPFRSAADPAWVRTLDKLEDAANLDLDPIFADIADRDPLMLVIGGDSVVMRSIKTAITKMPGAFVPEMTIASIKASTEEKVAQAIEFLDRAVEAVGGSDRLEDIQGYYLASTTRSGRGPRVHDETWFRLDGRLRRLRRVLATTIETVVDQDGGEETAGDRRFELDSDEITRMVQAAKRHPLTLLTEYATGDSDYELLSIRAVGDRQMAVVERVSDPTGRIRMEIDTVSGLVRAVESEEARELGDSQFERIYLRDEFRDYRNSGAGIRAPYYRASFADNGVLGLVTEWSTIEVRPPSDEELSAGGGETAEEAPEDE